MTVLVEKDPEPVRNNTQLNHTEDRTRTTTTKLDIQLCRRLINQGETPRTNRQNINATRTENETEHAMRDETNRDEEGIKNPMVAPNQRILLQINANTNTNNTQIAVSNKIGGRGGLRRMIIGGVPGGGAGTETETGAATGTGDEAGTRTGGTSRIETSTSPSFLMYSSSGAGVEAVVGTSLRGTSSETAANATGRVGVGAYTLSGGVTR
ncbi:hypothetical protein K474DRAFT_967082 [Panus rudis PR-1116 ss-1]|nr:hypothetical protein K474DRAFT_967082 [Panus rudis PR-1116 ss-1]